MKKLFPLPVILFTVLFIVFGCTREEDTGTIYGTVTDYATGEPLKNVSVKLRPGGETTLTGSDGTYMFQELPPGKYSLYLSKAEYKDVDDSHVIELEAGKNVRRDIQMRKRIASLSILDMSGEPLDTLDFGEEESVSLKTFNIFNDGTEVLTCTTTYDCDWIVNVSGLENPVKPGETVPVSVRIDRVKLADGENTTFLYITSENGSNEIVVKATFRGVATITTGAPTDITANSVTISGEITDDGGRPVLARGICYGTSQTPDINGEHTEDGSGTGSFSHNITGLSTSTTYYARAYATNRNGTYYGNVVDFTTESGLPTVTTADIIEITATTAKGGGNVTGNGGYNVTERGICWNTMGAPDLNDQHTNNGGGNGSFTSNMTGLTAGTTYYVRAYAKNSAGANYGEEKTFTTLGGEIVIALTDPDTSRITATSAFFSANITYDGGASITERGICWSTSQYPTVSSSHISLGNGIGTFAASIDGLNPSTTYYVRAYAINAAGISYSNQVHFTTKSGLPTITTVEVSDITATTVKCGGVVTGNGGFNVTARGVCWNTMGNPDAVTDPHTLNGNGNGSFISNVTGLIPGTIYHIRAYATNSIGTQYGQEYTFTTLGGNIIIILTEPNPMSVTATSVSCSANISDDGGAAITERGICWSTSQYPTIDNAHTSMGNGTGEFTVTLSGLTPGTTYYVRAYATNVAGTSYSNQIVVTTGTGLPVVATGAVSNITAYSAVCGGAVAADGGFQITAKGLCWSTSQYPTISGSHSNEGGGTGPFTSSMTNLQVGTTYYVRAYATNSMGTEYGEQVSFITSSGEAMVTTGAITNITALTATSSVTVINLDGATLQECGVCWAMTPNPIKENNNSQTASGYSINTTYSCNLTGLVPNTTYYVRAYATTDVTTSYGNQITFTTVSGLPVLTTTTPSATSVTITSGGDISSDGGYSITERGVCYSTTNASPTLADNYVSNGMGQGTYSCTITGVSVSTTYYVRAYATNSIGTAYGDVKTVVTGNGLPTVSTTTPTLNGTTVSTGGNVTDDGGYTVTARGVCYGSLPYPDLTSTYSHTSDGNGLGYYSSSFSLPGGSGIRYIRAYATNANGTSYGEQVTVIHPYDELPTFEYAGHTYRVAPCPHASSGEYISWLAANDYCENLSAYGYSDWRLPTLSELQTMYQMRSDIGGWFTTDNSGSEPRYQVYWSSDVFQSVVYGEMHYAIRWSNGAQEHFSDLDQIGRWWREVTPHYWLYAHVRPIRVED